MNVHHKTPKHSYSYIQIYKYNHTLTYNMHTFLKSKKTKTIPTQKHSKKRTQTNQIFQLSFFFPFSSVLYSCCQPVCSALDLKLFV